MAIDTEEQMVGPRGEPMPELVRFAFLYMAAKQFTVRMLAAPGLTESQVHALRTGHGWFKVNAWEWCLRAMGARIEVVASDGQATVILPQALLQERIDRATMSLAKMYVSAGRAVNSVPSIAKAAQQACVVLARPWPTERHVSRTLGGVVRLLASGLRDPNVPGDTGLLPYQLSLASGLLLKRTNAMLATEYGDPGACPALDVLHMLLAAMGFQIHVIVGDYHIAVAEPQAVRDYRAKQVAERAKLRGAPKRVVVLTAALRSSIVEALKQGQERRDIAEQTGVAPGDILRIARANKIPCRIRGKVENRSKMSREQIIAMIETGAPRAEVAKRAGVSRQRIDAIARSLGIPSRVGRGVRGTSRDKAISQLNSYSRKTS